MSWATHYIAQLQAGETITFSAPGGNSMRPRIVPGQVVSVTPDTSTLEVGDVVLCKVNGRQYLHLIKAIQGKRFQIGNNHGRINGWIGFNGIFGKVL